MNTDLKGIRATKLGNWEATISHRLIPGGRAFRTFSTVEEACAFKLLMLAQLAKGVCPRDLQPAYKRMAAPAPKAGPKPLIQAPVAASRHVGKTDDLTTVLERYLMSDTAGISYSDRPMVEYLKKTVTGTVQGLSNRWVDAWIRSMKQKERIAPGTIRKRVESFARCIDWWYRANNIRDTNPLRELPVGYSIYRPEDRVEGWQEIRDTERDRRLSPDEAEKIENVFKGHKRDDRERAWAEGGDAAMLMLFRLIVATGLRLREAYTLRVENINFDLRTIHVRQSKTGRKRDVPITSALAAELKAFVQGLDQDSPVFHFWDGTENKDALARITNALSKRFVSAFEYAGSEDLVEHDLRHEATCRWMEMKGKDGQWLFRPEEVMKITGHKTQAVFMRYLSLRGSDLAARLD